MGKKLRVLDDGFVRVVDYMGTDAAVVQAARVSYGAGTKKMQEDTALIRYLMRHRHTTPFEMCELKLHIRVPMDCWRQWVRHRTASINEYSTRYSVAIDSAQRTQSRAWRLQARRNRQGSANTTLPEAVGTALSQREAHLHREARRVYEERLEHGVAREQARKDLPLATYTEAYWKTDLHNLLHFLDLRMDSHAQHEIREYAGLIGTQIVALWCPETWRAFLDYRRSATLLSRLEIRLIRAICSDEAPEALKLAREAGLLSEENAPRKNSRERVEVEAKLAALGLHPPWSTEPAS